MTAIPAKTDFTGASVTEGEYKTALHTLHDYLTGMLGTAGTQAAALATLGALGGAVQTRTAAYTVTAADRGQVINCFGSWTLALTSAVALGAGFLVAVVNSGTGSITVDPEAAETVGGKSTLKIGAGSSAILVSDGTVWLVIGAAAAAAKGFRLFTSSDTFTVPDGVTKVKATIIGGGGGGGRGNSAIDYDFYGGNGGRGGQWIGYLDVTPESAMAVTVGTGGAGSNTASASAGSPSSFGGITAAGGGAGAAASGANGASGSDGTISSGGFGAGSRLYEQAFRSRAANSTAAVQYSSIGTYHPGAGGEGEFGSAGYSNAAGGVGGLVLIEW